MRGAARGGAHKFCSSHSSHGLRRGRKACQYSGVQGHASNGNTCKCDPRYPRYESCVSCDGLCDVCGWMGGGSIVDAGCCGITWSVLAVTGSCVCLLMFLCPDFTVSNLHRPLPLSGEFSLHPGMGLAHARPRPLRGPRPRRALRPGAFASHRGPRDKEVQESKAYAVVRN